jgi:hypothetical protein
MNANELADELENGAQHAEDHATIAIRVTKAATMLRQQQSEIGFYKQDADRYKQKCASQQAEIEALKKTIESLFGGLESSLALNKAQTERNQ